jgi:hypothetical protein
MTDSSLIVLSECTNTFSAKEIREWVQLVFVIFGGYLAYQTFAQNMRQRRVENALKFIALFREGLHENDLNDWDDLFHSATELAGAKPDQYIDHKGNAQSIGDYFTEGAPTTAIARMAQSLDIVCHQVMTKSADAQTVYYELGQLLRTMHYWLANTPSYPPHKTILDAFPSLKEFFSKFKPEKNDWPHRVYSFIE